ncbi:alpha/beta hydrolase [Formosa sp. PL04]|uniref:alpha/beta hydrolase n=1 Tax=Formosa sp. PL04 TaxID=3081755 RepID=UPI002982667F|nr:alpha/beta hydrolase [Formosa sp. PL04]MDW5290775.1 alpha/beta hydrolase [Formosa sp. PL04]
MKTYTYIAFLFLFTISTVNSQTTDCISYSSDSLSQRVVYKIIDGNALTMDIYKPNKFKSRKKYPTLVLFFGGGWKGGSISQLEPQAKYFASRGMVTVLVDYRVKSRQDTSPFEAVSDAKSAIRFLREHAKMYNVNPKKIAAMGASAGGHIGAATAMVSGLDEPFEDASISSKANALVLLNPVIDNGPGGYGYERIGERYMEISPLHNITKGAPPTIVFQGTEDQHTPVATIEKFKANMESAGNRCDLYLYEGEKHGFFNKGKQKGDTYYIETVHDADLFLESIGYLKGKPTI